ncbi:MAG: ABC transporter substrate-binding protein [Deinococcales bacterium]
MRRSLQLLATLLLLASAQAAAPFTVGVIVAKEGTARVTGDAESLAAIAYASRLRAAGGIFGTPLEVRVEDDAGDPAKALDAARALIGDGVDALLCCTTEAASEQVAQLAEHAGVALLSPSTLQGVGATPYWSFSLAARDKDVLAAVVADASARGLRSVGLMTLDNAFGDQANADLKALLAVAGLDEAGVARYPPGTDDLTPEALWIATRQPGAVVVWGLKPDLMVAVDGLRRRGFRGPVYARSALLKPVMGGLDLTRLEGVRFAVPPVMLVQHGLPADARCGDAARTAARRLQSVYGGVIDLGPAAPVYDALDLLRAAFEQVAALRLPQGDLGARRQAVRDSLVGLPPTCGAGGLYNLQEGRRDALQPAGLAIAVVKDGQLVAAP